MIMVVVSIRDRASGCFSRPVFTQSEGTAIRSFGDEVNRDGPDNELRKHPEDFDLYCVGAFDDSSGAFMSEDQPRLLIKGVQSIVREA